MPNYLYRCEKCGKEKESMQAVNNRNIFDGFPCRDPKCSGDYKRVKNEKEIKKMIMTQKEHDELEEITVEQICENIQGEMDKIVIKDENKIIRAISELMYSASEGELFPFEIGEDEDLKNLIKLIEVAKKFKNKLPTIFTL